MLLIALLLAIGPGGQPGPGRRRPSAAPTRGTAPDRVPLMLRMGRYVQADKVLASLADPSPLQRLQHTQALLGMGRCAEGEAALPTLSTAQQNQALSLKLATCHAHHQQWHRAAEWLLQAEGDAGALQPGQSALLWLTLSRGGEEALAQAVAERAEERAPAHDQFQLTQAMRALDLGDAEAVDAALWMLPASAHDRAAVYLLNAELELDLGNLAAAERHAMDALDASGQDDVRALALLAESRRRMGWSSGAAMALRRRPLLVAHHPRLRNVAIRLAVDQGELETAARLLQAGLDEGTSDPALFASAWYLHQALQDGQAAVWAQRWSAVNTSPLRTLEAL